MHILCGRLKIAMDSLILLPLRNDGFGGGGGGQRWLCPLPLNLGSFQFLASPREYSRSNTVPFSRSSP